MSIKEKYKRHYKPFVEQYAKLLRASYPAKSYQGIPHLFLPAWGRKYERSFVKTAFIGLETYGWGDTCDFLHQVEAGKWDEVFDVSEFQKLKYVEWTNGHRYTFWGFVMYFLAALYGVKNWELLKQKKHVKLLDDFVWGNATSIERYGNCDTEQVAYGPWEVAKNASQVIDDFQHLKDVFNPKVVILMCGKAAGNNYLRNSAKELMWSRDGVLLYKVGDTYVFHLPHPNNMRFNRGADFYAKTVRKGLKELKLVIPLEGFSDHDKEAEEILSTLVKDLKSQKVPTREAVAYIASALRKRDSCISVRMLCRILTDAGYKTSYGCEYSAGRGSYRMVASAWRFFNEVEKRPDVAEDIALAFTRPNGAYAYE